MPQASSMDELGRETLRGLVEASGPCVSIFMPTHRAGNATNQDPIRLKNLLRQAEEQLQQRALRAVEARQILEPARELLDDYAFWRHQSDGLAVYVAPGQFRSYRLPIPFLERVVASDRFYLKPLLPALIENGRFYILALSQNHVRLLNCTRFSVDEVSLGGLPSSIEEVEAPENIEADNSYQIFGATPAPSGSANQAAWVFGRGRADIDPKDRLQEFFRKIDAGICEKMKALPAPLLLAAVDYLHPLYRQASSCSSLLDKGLPGNPELMRSDQLLAQALPLVEPHLRGMRERDRQRFHQQLGTGRASKEWADVVPAALQGRVEVLFTAQGAEQWGRVDPASWEVEAHSTARLGDTDLLDLAAIHAWLNGAHVYVVPAEEVPGGAAVAAIFRY